MEVKEFARLFLQRASARKVRSVNTTPRKDETYGDNFVVAYMVHHGKTATRDTVRELTEEMHGLGEEFFIAPTKKGFKFGLAVDAPVDKGQVALALMGLG